MNNETNGLKQAGIYLAKKGQQDVIIRVEGHFPMLRITGIFDLTRFAKEGKPYGNATIKKDIEVNTSNYLFQPLDIQTILNIGSEEILLNQNISMTSDELLKYGDILSKLGIIAAKRAIMLQYECPVQQTEVYLRKIREFNKFPYDYNGPDKQQA